MGRGQAIKNEKLKIKNGSKAGFSFGFSILPSSLLSLTSIQIITPPDLIFHFSLLIFHFPFRILSNSAKRKEISSNPTAIQIKPKEILSNPTAIQTKP
jgi:hypothetical protein